MVSAHGQVVLYHAPGDANCRVELVPINTQQCIPTYNIVCEEEDVTVEKIAYEKVCKDIVDVACGLPVATPVNPYHQCHEVTRQHCYLVPKVEAETQKTPKCHVVTKAKCEEVTHHVTRHVCDHGEEEEVTEDYGAEVTSDEKPSVKKLIYPYYPYFQA